MAVEIRAKVHKTTPSSQSSPNHSHYMQLSPLPPSCPPPLPPQGIPELQLNKNLVELQEVFFGSALAYDEGIASNEYGHNYHIWT